MFFTYCSDEFQCYNGQCIPGSWECDDIVDCSRGEDEQDCYSGCQYDEWQCAGGDECIPHNWICDNYTDCWDGSDEMNCSMECAWDEFRFVLWKFYRSSTSAV